MIRAIVAGIALGILMHGLATLAGDPLFAKTLSITTIGAEGSCK